MRKWNNILARVIIVLFLLHALMGSVEKEAHKK
mgnify:CR=1 FL=1